MARALSLVLLPLVVMTLLWGGCVSCSEFFMFDHSHACCQKDHECVVSTLGDLHAAPAALPALEAAEVLAPVEIAAAAEIVALPPEPLPPDRLALLSTFLI